ncbi:hypothetical protein GLA29479_1114 [Lysobacter antibioticus]|nr:hypothetical protein GLA29479_1114 [Lysobacter antibioticus]
MFACAHRLRRSFLLRAVRAGRAMVGLARNRFKLWINSY